MELHTGLLVHPMEDATSMPYSLLGFAAQSSQTPHGGCAKYNSGSPTYDAIQKKIVSKCPVSVCRRERALIHSFTARLLSLAAQNTCFRPRHGSVSKPLELSYRRPYSGSTAVIRAHAVSVCTSSTTKVFNIQNSRHLALFSTFTTGCASPRAHQCLMYRKNNCLSGSLHGRC